jgi:hypothetical protein
MVVYADRFTRKETNAEGNDVEPEIRFLNAHRLQGSRPGDVTLAELDPGGELKSPTAWNGLAMATTRGNGRRFWAVS